MARADPHPPWPPNDARRKYALKQIIITPCAAAAAGVVWLVINFLVVLIIGHL